MKKTFFIWMVAALCVSVNVTAQYGGGRYGGRGGGFGGAGRGNRYGGEQRAQSQSNSNSDQISLTNFPEITGLTLKQKLEVSTLLTNEQKDILKIKDQKQELQVKIDHASSQKETDKYTKKMEKLDDKIQQVSQKTEKKIQAVLTNDQYREFTEKKDQIKFGTLPGFGNGFRSNPPNGNFPNGREQLNNQ
ncbi:MAG: hypothetical protein LBE79_12480 [Tannerella sp.]|jgi:hypothetical protein|nr:hypothetical protein [Tannerella sp.]